MGHCVYAHLTQCNPRCYLLSVRLQMTRYRLNRLDLNAHMDPSLHPLPSLRFTAGSLPAAKQCGHFTRQPYGAKCNASTHWFRLTPEHRLCCAVNSARCLHSPTAGGQSKNPPHTVQGSKGYEKTAPNLGDKSCIPMHTATQAQGFFSVCRYNGVGHTKHAGSNINFCHVYTFSVP